jgi:hypothetical protein
MVLRCLAVVQWTYCAVAACTSCGSFSYKVQSKQSQAEAGRDRQGGRRAG